MVLTLRAGSEQSYPKNGDADKGGGRPDQGEETGYRMGDARPSLDLTGNVALLGMRGTGRFPGVAGRHTEWLSTVGAVDNRRAT